MNRTWLKVVVWAAVLWLVVLGLVAISKASPEAQAAWAFGVPMAVLTFGGGYLFVTKDDV
ncbi:MAG: hypothetical protein KAI73_01545 [Rhodospirillaceae bacterium]|nr:hypothetical protein [Rhodospirillaceae bacterium]